MKKTFTKILITLSLLYTALPLYAFVPEITANASSFGSATAETVAGAVAGAALATHGVDDMQAGFRQFMTGRDTDTMTSGLMQSAGISRNTANNIETIGSALATGGASYLSTAASSTIAAETEMVTVSRWGREGLESGDWVMKGGTSALPSANRPIGSGSQMTPPASSPTGNSSVQMRNGTQQPRLNSPGSVGNQNYTGHAFDQMQNRGIVPSVVENTIRVGESFSTRAGTSGYYDAANQIRVIVNSESGSVITVIPGSL